MTGKAAVKRLTEEGVDAELVQLGVDNREMPGLQRAMR